MVEPSGTKNSASASKPEESRQLVEASDPIPAEILDLVEKFDLPPQEKRELRVLLMQRSISHHGPIPPPELIEGYERIVPGLGEKIVGWADSQHNHRLELEKTATTGAERRMDVAQKQAFYLAACGIIAATGLGGYMLYLGSNNWAIALVVITILLVTIGGPSVATILSRYLGQAYMGIAGVSPEEKKKEATPPSKRIQPSAQKQIQNSGKQRSKKHRRRNR